MILERIMEEVARAREAGLQITGVVMHPATRSILVGEVAILFSEWNGEEGREYIRVLGDEVQIVESLDMLPWHLLYATVAAPVFVAPPWWPKWTAETSGWTTTTSGVATAFEPDPASVYWAPAPDDLLSVEDSVRLSVGERKSIFDGAMARARKKVFRK